MRDEELRVNAWIDYYDEHKTEVSLSAHPFSEILYRHGEFTRGWLAAKAGESVPDTETTSEDFRAGHFANLSRGED
jgi:hypothetical protein